MGYNRLPLSAFIFLSIGLAALVQQGCAVKETVVAQPNESAPNALQVEQDIEAQMARIAQAQKTGDLEPPMSQGLVENDEMVRGLSLKFRASNSPHDLTDSQAAYLETLLQGNSETLNDALQRRDVWVQAFEGNWNYNFESKGDRLLVIAVLQSRLKDQENALRIASEASVLTPDQVREGKDRIQSVRGVEINDFRQKGSLDLSSDEILELQQMADDSGRFIRFLAQGAPAGAYAQSPDTSGNYPTQAFANVLPTNPNYPGTNTSSKYWDGRPINLKPKAAPVTPAPTATLPPPAPTFTPVPPVDTPTPLGPLPSIITPGSFPQYQFPFSNSTASQPAPSGQPAPSNQSGPSTQPAPSAQPSVAYLAVDSLKARDKQLDQQLDAIQKQAKIHGNPLAAITRLRKAFHQTLKNNLRENQQKGVTQEQMNQLSKMLDDFAKAVADLASPTPEPAK